jgi:ABC-type nitrate/sulfonate/bicarbonate transport system permease component
MPRLPDRVRLIQAAALVLVLLLWQGLSALGLPEYVLSPMAIARALGAALSSGELYGHIGASLMRSVPGFLLGSAIGVALGLLAGTSRAFDEVLTPPVFLTYPVPKIVFLPIFMLWFGIGDVSKILIIALACAYPAFINAYYGARSTPNILVWSGLNMGASRWRLFSRVVVPSALPLIFAALRVSLALSFIVMFAAEMINSRSGLGYLIRDAENSLRFDLMYVSLATIAILGYAGDRLLRFARHRVLAWQDTASA